MAKFFKPEDDTNANDLSSADIQEFKDVVTARLGAGVLDLTDYGVKDDAFNLFLSEVFSIYGTYFPKTSRAGVDVSEGTSEIEFPEDVYGVKNVTFVPFSTSVYPFSRNVARIPFFTNSRLSQHTQEKVHLGYLRYSLLANVYGKSASFVDNANRKILFNIRLHAKVEVEWIHYMRTLNDISQEHLEEFVTVLIGKISQVAIIKRKTINVSNMNVVYDSSFLENLVQDASGVVDRWKNSVRIIGGTA